MVESQVRYDPHLSRAGKGKGTTSEGDLERVATAGETMRDVRVIELKKGREDNQSNIPYPQGSVVSLESQEIDNS